MPSEQAARAFVDRIGAGSRCDTRTAAKPTSMLNGLINVSDGMIADIEAGNGREALYRAVDLRTDLIGTSAPYANAIAALKPIVWATRATIIDAFGSAVTDLTELAAAAPPDDNTGRRIARYRRTLDRARVSFKRYL